MERERVVAIEVDGAGGPGSGYVIAPRLVLASAHVVPEPGLQVSVFRPGRTQVWRARVVWRGTPGGRNDAALLHIEDPGWTPMATVAVRWGRLATTAPDTPCETWGRADLVQQAGRAVDTAHPSGTLNPGDREVGNRYVMHLGQHPPRAGADGGSPWGGLSGAALFCGRLLTGVIAVDPARRAHAALEAVPAYVLLHDAAFRTALAEHGGPAHSVLEPVEWQDLAEAADPTGSGLVRSPAALLRARRQTVPFRGRDTQLEQLEAWSAEPGFGALLLHGSGGQGKTRLAQHLANTLTTRRWSVLWLRPDTGLGSLDVLAQAAVPLLVVVDYAETRTSQLADFLEAAARHTGSTPVKLLLVARTAGDWWKQLQAQTVLAEELLDGAPTIDLPPLEPTPGLSHTNAYHEAVHAYASHLPHIIGLQHHDWPAIATRLTHSTAPALDSGHAPRAAGQSPTTALTLHMSALADLLDTASHQDQDLPTSLAKARDDNTVEDRLLKHEERYWSTSSTHLRTTLTQTTLTDALTAAFLAGADSTDEADALLARLPALHDQSRDRRNAVRDWITALYPPTTPGRPWDTLQPDRLAERFIGRRLLDRSDLARHVIAGGNRRQATQLLTVYTRATAHPVFQHQLDAHLTALCAQHSDVLVPSAIEVATQTEEPQPLLDALNEIIHAPNTSLDRLKQWADQLPETSRNLAPWAAHLTQLIANLQRERSSQDPHQRPDLAGSLNNLANRLAALGRHEEALKAITEAVQIRRQLAHARPAAFRPNLAGSLNNLANRLAALGRHEEALKAITEATNTYRELAHARPDAFRPDLAMSLNNLANRLGRLGHREEALKAITEAVQIRRQLAHARPDAFRPNLATSLNNLANRLAALGHHEEALKAITEAVQIRRQLAHARPDAFRPNLATSLNNLANRLAALGHHEEALKAITEATNTYRELAHARPAAFRPNLAGSLNNLANRLGRLGRHEEALKAITEATNTYRELAHARPDALRPDLAMSLNNLAIQLGRLGHREEALKAITEAVQIRRQLAHARPDAFRPDLATSLNNLANPLAALGHHEEALKAITEATNTYRELAHARPDAFRPDLAMSLNNLAIQLGRLGHREEALKAITEAVQIRRQLAHARPDAFRPDLATSLNNLANPLAALGHHEEALKAITEATNTYRELAHARPDAFRPDLAMSLNNLAIQLGRLGHREEALKAITEAVQIRRQLARTRPAVYQEALEQSLEELSLLQKLAEALPSEDV